MTSQLNADLLSDTLNVVQLARQAAMVRGNQDRAGKLSTVANELHKVVSDNGQVKGNSISENSAAEIALQSAGNVSFHSLLHTAQKDRGAEQPLSSSSDMPITWSDTSNIQERNRLVSAMAAGTMSDVDIARQLGITRDEVRAILSLNRANQSPIVSPPGGES